MLKTVLMILLLAPLCALAAEEKDYLMAPVPLPHTTPAMHAAGYWIGRHPAPDKVILSPQGIAAFNARVQDELNLTIDIFSLVKDGRTQDLLGEFERKLNDLTTKGYYTADGGRSSRDFIEGVRKNVNLSGIVLGVEPRYGLVVHYADVRLLPTADPVYETAGDVNFDELQDSSLDVGAPVAVVHQSADKKWFYVFSPLKAGWVQADRIAIGDIKTVRDYAQSKDFVVVTAAKGSIFSDAAMTRYAGYARMGTRLPSTGMDGAAAKVRLPVSAKDKGLAIVDGYTGAAQVHEGYLPYTARNIINQSFGMLGQFYGWGGMYGEQDCSAFLDEVFGTVGIILPRDTKDQVKVGQMLASFDEKAATGQRLKSLAEAVPGSAILPMKGHIMLYLGSVDGRAYAIHAAWAYREHRAGKDVPRVIGQVAVSDLSLGEGSAKGSWLKRLTGIVAVQ